MAAKELKRELKRGQGHLMVDEIVVTNSLRRSWLVWHKVFRWVAPVDCFESTGVAQPEEVELTKNNVSHEPLMPLAHR